MHIGDVGEGMGGCMGGFSRLGKRPKAFRAPVSDNPLTWRTVTREGSLTGSGPLRDITV